MGEFWGRVIAIVPLMALAACGVASQSARPVTASNSGPKGYLVAEIAVIDAQAYARYAAAAGPVITACGGTYLARGGKVQGLEGAPPEPRFVIVEFDSFAAAKACYESSAYQAVAPIRRAASRSRFWLSEGLPR